MKMEAGQWIRLTKKADVHLKYKDKVFKLVKDVDNMSIFDGDECDLAIFDEKGTRICYWTPNLGKNSSFYWECEPAVPPDKEWFELDAP